LPVTPRLPVRTPVSTPRSHSRVGKARGRRVFDLLVAATALAVELPLYTRNPADSGELAGLVEVIRL
jgi:predicted nucleic acid-binding protein